MQAKKKITPGKAEYAGRLIPNDITFNCLKFSFLNDLRLCGFLRLCGLLEYGKSPEQFF